MLDFMRRQAQGWIVKVLFALIVMSFAMWGVGDYFSGQSTVKVADVGGQTISQQALQQRVRDERNRLRRLLGNDFDPDPKQLQARVLRDMIRSRLLDLEAARLGLTASDAAVRRAIQSQPAFQVGGSFSTERYRSLIGRMGMGPSDYEARIRRDLAVADLRDFVREGTVVAEGELWQAFRREHERRSVEFFRLSPAAFADQVSLKEAALKAHYEANRDAYRRPAQARVRYVELTPEAIADQLEPEPGELEAFYQDTADRYASDNGATPALAEVREEVLADWRQQAAVDRIYERLPTFKDLLYTRDDLKAVAKEFGLEVRTSPWIPQKGELPAAVPQAEAFRKAAFAVQPGRNSRAQEIGDARFAGLHVIERRSPAVQEFSVVEAQVRRDLRRKRARELAAEAADRAAQALAGGGDPSALAEEYGVEVETVEGVKRAGMASELPGGLGQAVFAADQGGTGSARVGRGGRAVFRVTAVTAPERDELTESQRQELAARLRRQRGQARMEGLYERLRQRYEVRIRQEFAPGQAS
jgi:peptidyl-prolyl cis-trans isomerase D